MKKKTKLTLASLYDELEKIRKEIRLVEISLPPTDTGCEKFETHFVTEYLVNDVLKISEMIGDLYQQLGERLYES